MASDRYERTKKLLEEEIIKIWLSKPADVANLSNVLGAFEQSGSVKIYADAETKQLADVMTRLRAVLEAKAVDTSAISIIAGFILDAYAEQWPRYYQFKEIPKVMEAVAQSLKHPIKDAAELDEILMLCVRYVYRVAFWVDTEIPWECVANCFH